MITKSQLKAAGAGHNVEIVGYYRTVIDPSLPTVTVKEYALTKHSTPGTVPELYELVNTRDIRRIKQGLPAVETFMKIVQSATMAEVS